MDWATTAPRRLSRRGFLHATAGVAAAATIGRATLAQPPGASSRSFQPSDPLLRALDEKIQAAMAQHKIPGVAVGMYYQGQEYVRGYGVTNLDYPQPVDGDTLFRIGSTTKTFTGTTIMRLVEQGLLDLDAPVRTYLPSLRLADESVAARVTVRQILNHSAGWLGEYYRDFGRGADAVARYVAGMAELPQLTPPGEVFAYNNAAVVLSGHVIERIAGQPYEDVVRMRVLGDRVGLFLLGCGKSRHRPEVLCRPSDVHDRHAFGARSGTIHATIRVLGGLVEGQQMAGHQSDALAQRGIRQDLSWGPGRARPGQASRAVHQDERHGRG